MKERLGRNNDQQCLRGIIKFCERVESFPISKLASSFHSFGLPSATSATTTSKSILRKAKSRKIHVQPTSVQRRTKIEKKIVSTGSRNKCPKGQTKKNHFGPKEHSKKRPHDFVNNMTENVPAPKKAGRSMQSRTKLFSRKDNSGENSGSTSIVYNSSGEKIN